MKVSQGYIIFAVLIMLLLYQSVVSYQYNAINSGITNAQETLLLVREWGKKRQRGHQKAVESVGDQRKC